MEQLRNELNKIENMRQRAMIRAYLLAQFQAEKCSEAVLLERLEFLKTRTILELQVGDLDPNAPLETGEPYPPDPAPHSDGLPEHLRPMVEDAMQGQLERRAYFIQGYTGGMINKPNEYVLEWYKIWVQNRSQDSLVWLSAMFDALNSLNITWHGIKALAAD